MEIHVSRHFSGTRRHHKPKTEKATSLNRRQVQIGFGYRPEEFSSLSFIHVCANLTIADSQDNERVSGQSRQILDTRLQKKLKAKLLVLHVDARGSRLLHIPMN